MACQSQPSRILRHLALNVDEHLTGRNAGQRCAWLDVLVAMAGADVLVVVCSTRPPLMETAVDTSRLFHLLLQPCTYSAERPFVSPRHFKPHAHFQVLGRAADGSQIVIDACAALRPADSVEPTR